MNIAKKPYEISLWEDILTFVVETSRTEDGIITTKEYSGSIPPNTQGAVVAQYYKEHKICAIGSNASTSPICAVKPKLVSKINGENTLTFTMYSQYWDEQTQKLLWNPFMRYLTNERKIKLFYDNKWYDFIIKNINEDSSTKAFTYTCKDLFVNELSKSGFELEFDNELGNNMGNLPYLANKILEGSDWQLKEDDTETVFQYIEEPLYKVRLNNAIISYVQDYGPNGFERPNSSPSGNEVYVFYSCINNKSTKLQFLYDPSSNYPRDDKNVILNYTTHQPDGVSNFSINVSWDEDNCKVEEVTLFEKEDCEFISTLRGQRLVKSQKTKFDPKLNQTVKVYTNADGKEVWGFTETEYISPMVVQSYITNPSDFTSTTGWRVGKAASSETFPDLTLEMYPELPSYESIDNYDGHSYLHFSTTAARQKLMNSGISDNRSAIKSLVAGDQYVLDGEIYNDLGEEKASLNNFEIEIASYKFNDGVYETTSLFNRDRENNIFTCHTSLSEEKLKNARIGIFIWKNSDSAVDFYIKSLQFYPRKLDSFGNTISPMGSNDNIISPDIKIVNYYYDPNQDYTNREDLTFLDPNGTYVPYYGSQNDGQAYEKVRSIVAKETNRFNLLQSLSELFECWAKFEIEHDQNTGEILLDNEYRQQKWVSYRQYIGQDNYVGFRYGINLKSIKRTLDSNGAISKIIVKNNANEFAPNGFCSIARATENPSGENSIYNFDYYVGQGLIDFSLLNHDLYLAGTSQKYLGYYTNLKALNDEAQKQTEIFANISNDLSKCSSQKQVYELSVSSAQQDKADQEIRFRELTGFEISEALPEYQEHDRDKHGSELTSESQWKFYIISNDTYIEIDNWPTDDTNVYARLKWWDSQEAKKIKAKITQDVSIIRDHQELVNTLKDEEESLLTQKENIERSLDNIRAQKIELNKQFYKKYSRFIQEGSWISEDYMDDNLYYIDALSTLYTSSRPQVKYTIDVIELSQLPDWSNYTFKLGDKTYVEDKEFFGWAYDGSNRLYREEVIVSEIAMELDSPESNKITVQNYKTQFEDLFQRVVATTQQVQFSTGEYKRSAAIVQPDGTISTTTLQNSFLNNALTLQNANDQSVIIGDNGITTTHLSRPSEILRIVSGGIFLSNNGGESWTTGITANGINASCITTGQLNVAQVNLTMGEEAAFRWDSLGINAYYRDQNGISPNIFTRFDQFGLYGMRGSSNFDPLEYEDYDYNSAMNYIKDKADFGLTWDGFWLKSQNEDGYISISSRDQFEIFDANGNQVVQIGKINNNYGMKIGTENTSKVAIGYLDTMRNGAHEIIRAGDSEGQSFKVYEDGYIIANGGQIGNFTIAQINTSLSSLKTIEIQSNQPLEFYSKNGSILPNKIDLNVIANNLNLPESGYTWEYYDSDSTSAEKWTAISDSTTSSLDLEYDDFTDYEENPLYIRVRVTIDGEDYVKQVAIRDRTQAAMDDYYIKTNCHSVIEIIDNERRASPNSLEFQVFSYSNLDGEALELNNSTSTSTLVFKPDEGDEVPLDLVFEDNDTKATYTINLEDVAPKGTFVFTFLQDGKAVATKLIPYDYGVPKSLAEFNVNATNINAAVNSSIMEFSEDGLSLINTGFSICKPSFVQTEDTSKESGKTYYEFVDGKYQKVDGDFEADGIYYELEQGDKVLWADDDGNLELEGVIAATGGTIGGFTIGTNSLQSTSEYIKLYGNAGKAEFGSIIIDGSQSTLSSNSWIITPEKAVFNNIVANGAIETAVFKVGSVQAAGGAMIFRPSYRIEKIEGNRVTLDQTLEASPGQYVWLVSDAQYEIRKIRSINGSNLELDSGSTSTSAPKTLVFLGDEGDLVIGINSGSNQIANGHIFGNGLTMNGFNPEGKGPEDLPALFLGNLTSLSGLEGFGLYADNVYLNGSLTTKIDNGSSYAGINTISGVAANKFTRADKYGENDELTIDTSSIVFWAGSKSKNGEDIQKAKFQVTEQGSLYASHAEIENSVFLGGTLKAVDIYTATLHGLDAENNNGGPAGLRIGSTSQGITFLEESLDQDSADIFTINANGMYTSNGNYFTKIDRITKDVSLISNDIRTIGDNHIKMTIQQFNNDDIPAIIHQQNQTEQHCGFYFEPNETVFRIAASADVKRDCISWALEETKIHENVSFVGEDNQKMSYVPVVGGYNLFIA